MIRPALFFSRAAAIASEMAERRRAKSASAARQSAAEQCEHWSQLHRLAALRSEDLSSLERLARDGRLDPDFPANRILSAPLSQGSDLGPLEASVFRHFESDRIALSGTFRGYARSLLPPERSEALLRACEEGSLALSERLAALGLPPLLSSPSLPDLDPAADPPPTAERLEPIRARLPRG